MKMKKEIDFAKIEKKWQKKWEEQKVFEAKESDVKKKFYVLEMFPYPSATGLHMGHALNYTIGDIFTRFKRMQGFNVLYPMGFDSFGLPAENAAIKEKSHPKKFTENAIKNYIRQMKKLGLSYDWSRMVETHKPEYYKWDQWIFLKMLEKGIAYRKKAPVNWCPKCNTVLANEQVHDGKCWRHEDTNIEIKHLEQWFFKTTAYADELYEGINKLDDWPELIKNLQRNWIGKSYGTEIDFEIKNPKLNCIIVHGCPSKSENSPEKRTYDKHWIPWIKKELLKKGIPIETPLMPEPWHANYDKWKKEFEKNEINENTILVGHSCGCAFLVRWLGETNKKIKKLILVAPWKITSPEKKDQKDFYEYKINQALKSNIEEIVYFTADDEESDGKKSLEIYYNALDGKIIELLGHGHYTQEDMGTSEFLELLNEIVEKWPIFTTRPDTIFGVTFMVVSAQHLRLMELVTDGQKKEVEKFLKKLGSVSEKALEEMEKEGVFTGSYAVNPMTGEKVPVYAGNFVVADYGSGMVMAVPAHDQRDFEFAKKYKIPIKVVVHPEGKKIDAMKMNEAYEGAGILINSEGFNGLANDEAKVHITKALEFKKTGREKIQFKLRDWLISRQRFWGTPIPVVYCDKCGIVPVAEKDLPVVLPENIVFADVKNPLVDFKKFTETKCPKCGSKARRETDTMDTFVNSSWYYLRYCDAHNDKEIFDKKKVAYWCPIDMYIGGKEHACMHLIYIRYYTKFLRDLGLVKFNEPVIRLFNQGMLLGPDGEKMSKSKGNVVLPETVSQKYGMDTARLFLVSVASPDKDVMWNEQGVEGSLRFLRKVFDYVSNYKKGISLRIVEHKVNKTIKEVNEDIEFMKYNIAVIKLRELFDSFDKNVSKDDLEKFIKMLSPFCPHITEEFWEKLGHKDFISLAKWPECDESKIDELL